jgi:hypothetical protein
MFFFGYATYPGREENPTGFFEYDKATQKQKDEDYGFRKSNTANLNLTMNGKECSYPNTPAVDLKTGALKPTKFTPPPACPAIIYSQRKLGLQA